MQTSWPWQTWPWQPWQGRRADAIVARLGVTRLLADGITCFLVGWGWLLNLPNPLGEARLGRLAAFLGNPALATLGGHLHEKRKEENEMG